MLIIGDVHGHLVEYRKIVDHLDVPSLQLGDMELGFPKAAELAILPYRHRFLRGNHDNPQVCRAHRNYAGDYGYWPDHRLFFMSGAFSVDYLSRIPGVSWWEDEQLSPAELAEAGALYVRSSPEIVVTHDAPDAVARRLFNDLCLFRNGSRYPSATTEALETMRRLWKPRIWVCGHWHVDRSFELEGTRFIILNQLSTVEVP